VCLYSEGRSVLSDDFVWRSGGPLKMIDSRDEREEVLRWCLRVGRNSFSFEKIEMHFIVEREDGDCC